MRPLLIWGAAAAGLLGSLALGSSALAQEFRPTRDYVTEFKITPQIIVDSIRTPPGAQHTLDRTQQQWDEYHRAHSYLRGVQDSPPITWCIPVGLKNSEVHGEVFAHLAALPPTARQGDAAPLIRDALLARYPCNKRKEH